MTYDAHLSWLITQERGARAEREGFVAASHQTGGVIAFTSDYERLRYQQGYEDGKAMLVLDGGTHAE